MKKSMTLKRIISLVAVIAIVLSFMTVTVSAGTVSDAKNSVVAVIRQDGVAYGTGFAIGEVGKPVEYIVTNCHVVQGENGDLGYTTATVGFDLAANDYMTANIYYYNHEKDVAVLKLPQATDKREAMVLCPMEYVDADDEFAALGYPGNQDSDWYKFNKDDISITKGGIKKADRYQGLDVYLLDLAITYGNSGGPLVNSAGEVVGINRGYNGENYALAIDELLAVINTDKIPVTLHGGINWLLIVAAIVLVAIIALVVLLVLRKKGSNNYEEPSYSAPVESVVNPTVPKETTPVSPAPQAGARVVAIGGSLNGKRFTVTGTVRIGRDASKCAIAFPVNTQGVSGVHCELSFNGSVCYIKDLNSSYGTYTVDGRKLAPNVAQVLKSGEKFYLASTENMFEVRF